MPMDGFTLSFMARELNEKLAGGRVDKVNQPERDALTLLIRSGGGNHRLLLSANANQARAQLTGQNYENPAEPPMFCMLMRKHLLGARVIRVEQLFGDRILAVRFDALDEMSDHVEKTLYLEVMGRYSDLTLEVAERYYNFGLKMVGGQYNTADDPFLVSRYYVSRYTGLDSFAAMVAPAGT